MGQHFLINKKKLEKIAGVLELKEKDVVIEIGPGHGELTQEIRNKKLEIRIIAIEKDKNLISPLKEKFPEIEIVEGDALKILPTLFHKLKAKSYKLCGNIPYYITGHLLRIISELGRKPELAVLTIQKEVAQRICAKPPKMNILAAATQFWAEPEIVGFISRKDFNPAPEVESAVIKLKTKNLKLKTKEAERYYKLVRILFKQPRKTVFNNIYAGFRGAGKEETIRRIQKAGIDPKARPQDLSVADILTLSTLF